MSKFDTSGGGGGMSHAPCQVEGDDVGPATWDRLN